MVQNKIKILGKERKAELRKEIATLKEDICFMCQKLDKSMKHKINDLRNYMKTKERNTSSTREIHQRNRSAKHLITDV